MAVTALWDKKNGSKKDIFKFLMKSMKRRKCQSVSYKATAPTSDSDIASYEHELCIDLATGDIYRASNVGSGTTTWTLEIT